MGETVQDCLQAAGCSPELCERMQTLEAAGYAKELLPQLAKHRMTLLNELRQTDEQLACLDRAISAIRSPKHTTHE